MMAVVQPRAGFTGRGTQVVADAPVLHRFVSLSDSQRAHVRSLIAREHLGTETEATALRRLIALTQADLVRYSATEIAGPVERRRNNLRTYLTEIETS